MTIMSVPASRHNSGFTIQSILGDIDNENRSTENEETLRKCNNSDTESSDHCNSCAINQTEEDNSDILQSRLHYGAFDGFSSDNFLRKLQYRHYGHCLSQEYVSRTRDEIQNFWRVGSEDGHNPFYLPFRLPNNFQHRGQASTNPDFLFSHLRKPKRVRTAFSPTQLLRLEHAFENNHYVVGQERKELAAGLALTETQVKVWFQNRRTKHKRIKAEDEMTRSLVKSLEGRNIREPSQSHTSDSESDIEV